MPLNVCVNNIISIPQQLNYRHAIIRILQMQFFIVIAQNAYALYTDCDYDKRVEWLCVIYLSSLFILFMNFFARSYIMKPTSHKSTTGQSSSTAPVGDIYSRTVKANGGLHYQVDAKKEQ